MYYVVAVVHVPAISGRVVPGTYGSLDLPPLHMPSMKMLDRQTDAPQRNINQSVKQTINLDKVRKAGTNCRHCMN